VEVLVRDGSFHRRSLDWRHCDTLQTLLVSVTMDHFLAAFHKKIVYVAEHTLHASLNSDSFNFIRVSAVTVCNRV